MPIFGYGWPGWVDLGGIVKWYSLPFCSTDKAWCRISTLIDTNAKPNCCWETGLWLVLMMMSVLEWHYTVLYLSSGAWVYFVIGCNFWMQLEVLFYEYDHIPRAFYALLKFQISKPFCTVCRCKTTSQFSSKGQNSLKTRMLLANVVIHNFSFYHWFKAVPCVYVSLLDNGCTVSYCNVL